MTMPAVEFQCVSKRFRLGETAESLGGLLAQRFRAMRRGKDQGAADVFWALRDVDFRVERGAAVGIIGPNGAGKSTVLRLLAKILAPDAGVVTVRGRLAALIEIGAGFHGDLTGRENVFLHGAILGMSRCEIRQKFDAIIDFAGLAQFVDTPVKRYSSGMYARLGFAVAAHVDPQVLLVDEVLSVGDALFRLRCMERMRELIRGGTALVFVTHQLDQMQAICRRAIVLEGGRTAFVGDPRGAVSHYMNAAKLFHVKRPTDVLVKPGAHNPVEVLNVRFLDGAGKEITWTHPRDMLHIEVTIDVRRVMSRMVLELNMRSENQVHLISLNSGRDGQEFPCRVGVNTMTVELGGLPVCGGQYAWNVRIWDNESGTTEVDTPFQYWLGMDDEGGATGALAVEHAWSPPVKESLSGTGIENVETAVAV